MRDRDRARVDGGLVGGRPEPAAEAPRPGLLGLQAAAGNRAVAAIAAGAARSGLAQAHGVPVTMPFALQRSGEGVPLDPRTRGDLEATLGHDMGEVRVHQDGQAERAGAYALAAGADIHFARDAYRPGSHDGFRLLAHEAAHVVQQREGRVPDPGGAGTTLVSDPGLEAEAEAIGRRAAAERGSGPRGPAAAPARIARSGGRAPTAQPAVAQPAWPAALVAIGVGSWEAAAGLATVVGTAAAVTGQVASAVNRGENAFASYNFPEKIMTAQDEAKLAQIAQFLIVNQYIDRYLAAHPEARPLIGPPAPAPVPDGRQAPPPTPGAAPDAAPGSAPAGPSAAPRGVPTSEAIDAEILTAVKLDVQRRLQTELESNLRTAAAEFVWGEDDSRSEESVGVTGWLKLRDMQAATLHYRLTLSADAKQIGISLPGEGTTVKVRRWVTGKMTGRANWSAWDNLAVNVEGGAAQTTVGPTGAPRFILRTHWYWDRWGPNSETWMSLTIDIDEGGTPHVSNEEREGTP
ncbi:DUF4157 domain-containing protein [Miltoncostaea marina]|uniref:eCIS core domain-containing protein n=1 Tax=Miltoncostaea marina TaxID=2843215 RepID=UPI001C3D00F6|nr:DUF4157 domain-containing protein [Miltoncostaea marina]